MRGVQRHTSGAVEADPSDSKCLLGTCRHPSIAQESRRKSSPGLSRLPATVTTNPAELRRSILRFLGGDPAKPSGRLKPHYNNDAGREKLRLTAKVRDRVAQFFEHELKACAAELGGRAKSWPARYGFSLLVLVVQVLDDLDIFCWVDWIT